jgi:uncharacterized repeat protein (TIGR03806 family)
MKTGIFLIVMLSLTASGCGGGGGGGDNNADDSNTVVGLDARPDNTSCIAPDRPTGSSGYNAVDVFPMTGPTGGRLRSATEILQAPGNNERWYVLEQRGTIVSVDSATQANPLVWLDFEPAVRAAEANGDGRMLGMTFHPDWPATPEVFVYYTGAPAGIFQSVVVRATLDNIDNPVSPVIETVLTVDQSGPFHKGGSIAFGPDGYLYLALGDGGSNPINETISQDTTNLLGSMLRINVMGTGAGYTIPVDNPFSTNPACTLGATGVDCPEIWAWGLRSPFRWSFDNQGRLFLGDVGRDNYEEINIIDKAGNYGWSCREGAHDGTGPEFEKGLGACPGNPVLIDPIYEYAHPPGEGASVTAGFIYSGSGIPALQGKFIFADYISGKISALTEAQPGLFTAEEIIDTSFFLPSIAQGNDGEIYIADRGGEKIRRLVTAIPIDDPIPLDLSETGCIDFSDPLNPGKPASGLIPYVINAPFWSDGADKERFLAVPNGETIIVTAEDNWDFPNGSVLIKNFRLQDRLIETRLLMRHPDGIWAGYTYEWDDTETAATRVIGGKITAKGPASQSWIYPSEGQCLVCHTGVAMFSLGPETAQLNREGNYPEGNGVAHQLETLDHIGMFASPLPDPATLPALADPFVPDLSLPNNQDLNRRARSWLHTNCSGCHQDGGPTQSSMDWRHTIALNDAGACEIDPADDLGVAGAKLLKPGEPEASIILNRLSRRDSASMPPLGSLVPSDEGVTLISDWITSLDSCNP